MKTALEKRFDEFEQVNAEHERVIAAFSKLEKEIEDGRVMMNECAEKAAQANTAALLDGGSLETAKNWHEKAQNAYRDTQLSLGTAKAVLKRRDECVAQLRAAKLAIATEFESVAYIEWDRISLEIFDFYKKFLEANRRRLALAVTCSRLFKAADNSKQPFDEDSLTRQRFSGECGCGDSGLHDLAPKFNLVQTSPPLAFRISREVESLPKERLIEIARQAEAELNDVAK
jgi:hypothetical protein